MPPTGFQANLDLFRVRPISKSDFDQVRALGDEVFGIGYLDSWFGRSSDVLNSICFVANVETKIIGMVHFSKLPNSSETSGFLQCLMVDKEYRRKGVATCLYKSALQALNEIGINHLQASCWKESLHPGIIPFLNKNGWEILYSREKYWYAESLERDYQCARCGSPCQCTAVWMGIQLLR